MRGVPFLACALLLAALASPLAEADGERKHGREKDGDEEEKDGAQRSRGEKRKGHDAHDDHGKRGEGGNEQGEGRDDEKPRRGEVASARGELPGSGRSSREADEARLLPPGDPPVPGVFAARPHRSWADTAFGPLPPAVALGFLAIAALALLALALLGARRAQRPPPPKPGRRTFEAGRARGVREGMHGEPFAALARSGLGEIVEAVTVSGGVRVALRRGRFTPCDQAAGYVTGLFEGAWARDVRVAHTACAGKDRRAACVYEVRAHAAAQASAAEGVSPSGARTGAASTRG